MSLVGPRPERPELQKEIEKEVPEFGLRLQAKAGLDVAFCPYRISPLGAHIDHQYGKINGLAIDKGIWHCVYLTLMSWILMQR